jgi:hypothetical protein
MDEASIHDRLEALKQLGARATHNTAPLTMYEFTAPVEVFNNKSIMNSLSTNYSTTISWNDGDGKFESALKFKFGNDSNWMVSYTSGAGIEYRSSLFLQEVVQADIKNPDKRGRVKLYITYM